MATQTQISQSPSRAERLGKKQTNQVYILGESGSLRSRAELLNSRFREGVQNTLDNREIREFISQTKQGNYKGVRGKLNIAKTAHKTTKIFSSENSRITNSTAFLMIGTAFLFDVLEMATSWAVIGIILSIFIGIFGTLTFFTWFTIKGVSMSFANPKKMFTFLITSGIETLGIGLDTVPLLGWIWTIGVTLMIIISRIEDRTGIKIPTSPKKAVTDTIKTI